jgi:hypothetical protein
LDGRYFRIAGAAAGDDRNKIRTWMRKGEGGRQYYGMRIYYEMDEVDGGWRVEVRRYR